MLGREVATRLYVFFFVVCICYMVTCVLFCTLVGCRILFYVLALCTHNSNVSWMDAFKWNASHHSSSKWMEAFDILSFMTLGSVVFKSVVAGTNCCTIFESCLRFTNHWTSTATIVSEFYSIFDRILVWTSASLAFLNPHTNIRHLNCVSW